MTEKKKRERVDARRATLAVLKVLQTATDETKPIHITDIVKVLSRQPYEMKLNRDTVKRILDDLCVFFPEIKCLDLRRSSRDGMQSYTYGYWYKQSFVVSEAEIEVSNAVKENISFLRTVIGKNGAVRGRNISVDFEFGGYGVKGKPVFFKTVTDFLPLKICCAYGNFYLIGLFRGETGFAHIRIDLMANIREHAGSAENNGNAEFARNKISQKEIKAYLSEHLYMSYEKDDFPRYVTLRIHKWEDRPDSSLTFLYDAFKGDWEVLHEDDETVDVRVKSLYSAIKIFAWNYIDRVEIIGPEDLKEEVNKEFKERFDKYLGGKKS